MLKNLAMLCAVGLLSSLLSSGTSLSAEPVRLMTFNVRYDNAGDGENRWDDRRDLVFDTIKQFDPDILGLQEPLPHQMRALQEAFPEYQLVGCGRDNGKQHGEFTAMLIRKSRLKLVEEGRFWFSETPETPGSKGWGAGLPRLCVWAKLADSENDEREFVVYNTHFDHQSNESRLNSAKAIAKHITTHHAELPVAVLGDFNTGLDSQAMKALVNDATRLADSFDATAAGDIAEGNIGTFNGFRGSTRGQKIDFVLVSPQWKVVEAKIDRTERDGRYPSDHFPVTAVLEFPTE